jgi:hypothetical protein
MNLHNKFAFKTYTQRRRALASAALLLFAFVATVGGLFAHEFRATTTSEAGRSLTSTPAAASTAAAKPLPFRKTGGLIRAEIVSESGSPVDTNAPFRLKAKVAVRTTIQELHYAWTLPEGVRLRTGTLAGTLTNVSAGDAPELVVELESDSSSLRRIQFRAWKTSGDARQAAEMQNTIGHSAVYLIGHEPERSTIDTQNPGQQKLRHQGGAVRPPEEYRRRAIQ